MATCSGPTKSDARAFFGQASAIRARTANTAGAAHRNRGLGDRRPDGPRALPEPADPWSCELMQWPFVTQDSLSQRAPQGLQSVEQSTAALAFHEIVWAFCNHVCRAKQEIRLCTINLLRRPADIGIDCWEIDCTRNASVRRLCLVVGIVGDVQSRWQALGRHQQ